MPTWKKVVVSGSAISQLNNDANYLATLGDSVISSSAQIGADISGSFVSASNALGTRIDNVSSTITLAADNGSNDTYTTGETLTFTGDNSISTTVSDNEITIALADGVVSSSAQVVSLVESGTDSNTFTDADHNKLDAIEAAADVTDTTNVTAAGALMDSEVTDLAGVKGVTISTLQVKPSEGAFADGDKTKLDAIEASADVTDTANVTSAGALMDSELTSIADVKALNQSVVSGATPTFTTTNFTDATNKRLMTDAQETKLDTVETNADVTDTANVTAAGALMDSELTDLAAVKAINQGLATSDNVTFANTTVTGNLTISGTTTTVNSETLNIDDNIIALNGNGAALGGIAVNDGPATGSLLWNGTDNRWVAGATGSESAVLTALGYGILSGSTQIAADISGSFVSASNALGTRIDNVASTITLSADVGSNDTYTTGETLTFEGDNSITTTVSDNKISFAIGDGIVSSSAQAVALVEAGTDSNTFTDTDHSKLNAIEAGADVTDTANVTSAGALMDSELASIADVKALDQSVVSGATPTFTTTNFSDASDKRLMTDAQETKLDSVETNADVTDTANVTSAGALMDSELTSIADVKALDQSVVSGATPTFTTTNFSDATNKRLMTDAQETKLDSVETDADVTDTANVTSAGAVMDSEVTDLAGIKGVTISTLQVKPSEGAFADGDKTKLDAIEASADVTDATNVTAAGALMDSELTSIADVKALNQSLVTGASPTFVGLTLSGDLTVSGTTTTINSNTLDIGDNIIALNGVGSNLGGIAVNDGPATGSLLWNGTDNRWVAGATGSESAVLTANGYGILSGSAQVVAAVEAGTDSNTFTDADHNKLNAIEAAADVTDTANVTSAGALMDSELASIADVKALDQSVVSGATPTFTTTNFSDASNKRLMTDAQETKLDSVETDADVTDTANVTAAGALMDSELTDLAGVKGVTISTLQAKPSEGAFANGDKTKLDAIEASADVTDATNVTAAGAVMDSELAEIATVKALTAAGISGSFVSASNALGARIDGISTDFDDITNKPTLISGSVISSPSQGTARLAVNGVNTDADLGLQAGDSPTFASLTLTGNLTVTGDRIEQQVTNLAVEDQFITINSGASAQDAGIFFEGQGASFGWDESENRFALDFTGGTAAQTTITSDAYVAAVAVANDDANYQKDGNLFVNDSGEAFIYVSS